MHAPIIIGCKLININVAWWAGVVTSFIHYILHKKRTGDMRHSHFQNISICLMIWPHDPRSLHTSHIRMHMWSLVLCGYCSNYMLGCKLDFKHNWVGWIIIMYISRAYKHGLCVNMGSYFVNMIKDTLHCSSFGLKLHLGGSCGFTTSILPLSGFMIY
jgi:hypothetical protein